MSDIKGLESFYRKLNNLEAGPFKEMAKQVKKEGKKVQGFAKLLCPVDTGELRNSIREVSEMDDTSVTSTVYTSKKYAAYVELGTGPVGQNNHEGISPEITPTYSQKGWSYYDKEKDEFIHTRGQPAQPYMYPALKDYEETAKNNICEAYREGLKKVCK